MSTPQAKKNLTAEVEDTLTREIMLGIYPPGEIFPSEFDSVKRFNVSRVTVRRAYANLEKKGILVRKIRCNTVVNDRLVAATDPISMVGALLPLNHTFSRSFLNSLNQAGTKEKALIVLAPPFETGIKQNQVAIDMVCNGVRNLVVWGYDHGLALDMFQRLRLLGINLVFFDHVMPGKLADYVSLDNKLAMEMLVQKALQDGFRKLVFVNTDGLEVESNAERKASFIEICKKLKLEYSLKALPWQKILNDGAADECNDFFNSLKDSGETAIFGVNYLVSKAISDAAGGKGHYYTISMPDDKKCDNICSVVQPIAEMAEMCFELLRKQQEEGNRWKAKDIRLKGTPDWK